MGCFPEYILLQVLYGLAIITPQVGSQGMLVKSYLEVSHFCNPCPHFDVCHIGIEFLENIFICVHYALGEPHLPISLSELPQDCWIVLFKILQLEMTFKSELSH